MLNLPIYSNKKLITAFEYGLMMGSVAKDTGIELTKEISQRMENIILKEFPKKKWEQLNTDMMVNLIAAFEPKDK